LANVAVKFYLQENDTCGFPVFELWLQGNDVSILKGKACRSNSDCINPKATTSAYTCQPLQSIPPNQNNSDGTWQAIAAADPVDDLLFGNATTDSLCTFSPGNLTGRHTATNANCSSLPRFLSDVDSVLSNMFGFSTPANGSPPMFCAPPNGTFASSSVSAWAKASTSTQSDGSISVGALTTTPFLTQQQRESLQIEDNSGTLLNNNAPASLSSFPGFAAALVLVAGYFAMM